MCGNSISRRLPLVRTGLPVLMLTACADVVSPVTPDDPTFSRAGTGVSTPATPRDQLATWESRSPRQASTGISYGDFDGDGVQDALVLPGDDHWYLIGSDSRLLRKRPARVRFSAFALGDFDGDGKTDVFVANGIDWKIASGGAAPWKRINTSTARMDQLAFGDFDGDGRTDVFRATGAGGWRISKGGTGRWEALKGSRIMLPDLALGDFDGDGKTDAFHADGKDWFLSRRGSTGWRRINHSPLRVPELRFADVDADGRTDVIAARDQTYSSAGIGKLRPLPPVNRQQAIRRGDWDGDGRPDSFEWEFSCEEMLGEVRRLFGGNPVRDGWNNEVRKGRNGNRLLAFGSRGRIMGWRIVDPRNTTLLEYNTAMVPASKKDEARKLKGCARELRRCTSMAMFDAPFNSFACWVGPGAMALCLLDHIATGPSRQDRMNGCLSDFSECIAA